MKRGLAITRWFLLSFALWGFFPGPPIAEAQVGVIPEERRPDEFSEVTLKFVGKDCDINAVKESLLGLEGIVDVNVEAETKSVTIYYLPAKVTKKVVMDLIGVKNKGCYASAVRLPVPQDETKTRKDKENKGGEARPANWDWGL